MAGIYIHIPFCRRACHYCDFHFSTTMKKRPEMVQALASELELRRDELAGEEIRTIYFGGGTPSVLSDGELSMLLDQVNRLFPVSSDAEITLEANPDDLSDVRIRSLSQTPVNRLSIGVQSFFDDDLTLMNRAHNAGEAISAVEAAATHFPNITLDLIYGIPGSTTEKWQANIERALSFGIPHISAYALTVEPRTALDSMIRTGKVAAPDETHAREQFEMLMNMLTSRGFIHYELSNFGKPGFFSRNNTAYWQGEKYIGIGPSAHSYDGRSRSWNVSNNSLYLKGIEAKALPLEREVLTVTERYNEMVMTGLRTMWGVPLQTVASLFGSAYETHLRRQAARFIGSGLLEEHEGAIRATVAGKFLTDGIASDLFY